MKKQRRNLRMMMLAIAFFGCVILRKQQTVGASSGTVTLTAGSDEIQVGDTISVSVIIRSSSASMIKETNMRIKYDTDCLEFSSQNSIYQHDNGEVVLNDMGTESSPTKKYILQFKALDTKVSKIWIEGTPLIYNSSGEALSVSKNVLQISIGERTKKSTNNNLSSLAAREGKLDDEFSKSRTDYTMAVSQEVKALTVLAVPEDCKAKVVITGADKLLVGENKVVITVISETKRTKDYNIVVTRGNMQSATATQKIAATSGQAKEEVRNQGTLTSKDSITEEDSGQGNEFSEYEFVSVDNLRMMPEGYLSVPLEVGDMRVDAYQKEKQKDQDMYLVFAKYQGGEPAFYMYDKKEGTLQRFIQTQAAKESVLDEKVNLLNEENDKVWNLGLAIGVCVGVIIMLLICAILMYMKAKGYTDELE